MDSDSLELFSSTELVEELLRRTTFQGVVIYAPDEAKNRHWDGERRDFLTAYPPARTVVPAIAPGSA